MCAGRLGTRSWHTTRRRYDRPERLELKGNSYEGGSFPLVWQSLSCLWRYTCCSRGVLGTGLEPPPIELPDPIMAQEPSAIDIVVERLKREEGLRLEAYRDSGGRPHRRVRL